MDNRLMEFHKGGNLRLDGKAHHRIGRRKVLGLLASGIIAMVLVLFLWAAVRWNLDLRVSGFFFHPDKQWYLKYEQPWWFLYRFGTVPGLLLTLAALAGTYLSFIKSNLRPYRRQMLVILLTAVIGGGIIINAVLKPYWGRPRPRNVAAFGGDLSFHHPHQRGIPGQGASFPCGHCTMGYVFVALLVFRRESKWVAYGGMGFGLIYGTLVGVGRIVQGAHFLTDVVASLCIIALTAIFLFHILPVWSEKKKASIGDKSRSRNLLPAISMVMLALLITLFFMTRRPFFEIYDRTFSLTGIDTIVLRSPVSFTQKHLHYTSGEAGRILIRAQGFGWVQAKHWIKVVLTPEGRALIITLEPRSSGYFSELNHEVDLRLPESGKERLKFRIEKTP